MNLYDPQRPTILHKPAFLPGQFPIPLLHIWPLPDGNIELSMLLPIKEDKYMGKFFRKIITPEELHFEISSFSFDPEQFVETHFGEDPNGFIPAMSKKNPPERPSKSPTSIDPSLSLTEILKRKL